jgi:hypothetical protein
VNEQFSLNTRCPNCRGQVPYSGPKVALLASLQDGREIPFQCSFCRYKWDASGIERKKIAAEMELRSAASEKDE